MIIGGHRFDSPAAEVVMKPVFLQFPACSDALSRGRVVVLSTVPVVSECTQIRLHVCMGVLRGLGAGGPRPPNYLPTKKFTHKNAVCRSTTPQYHRIYNSTAMEECE